MITTMFVSDMGCVEINDRFPGIFGYMPMYPDGKTDDCIYYFKVKENDVVECGWNYGRAWDSMFIEENNPWLADMADPEETEFHDEQYRSELLENLTQHVFRLADY